MQFSGNVRSGSLKLRAILSVLILLILLPVNQVLCAAPISDSNSNSNSASRGDANGDGMIDFADIPPFITALQSQAAYMLQFPNLDPSVVLDMNDDGVLNFSDIPGFIIALQSGGVDVEAPSDLETVPSGLADSISLTWTDSSSSEVTGYEVHYGLTAGSLTNVNEVGNVNSATISGLTQGQTWHVAVVAVASGRKSSPTAATITAQVDAGINIVPLFNAATQLEPETTIDTPDALTTYFSDRGRDRHAREFFFNAYDHYLSWYWQQRTMDVEIIDRVGRNGGTDITFNYTTHDRLNPAEFRTFFRGINTVAEYSNNQVATLVSTNPSATPGETDYNYSATISENTQLFRPIRVGDRVEIEISQFLAAPRNGRSNYYGTTLLYIVGEGLVPWAQGNDVGFDGGIVANVNQSLDSYPIPTKGWLGGKTTLHYQYSDEADNAFKQIAGNLAPASGVDFMLGRRLHHTDFGDGSHSEPGNPIFAEQVGKLGSRYIARSCVECHVNNGRALPPAIGDLMTQTSLRVGIDSRGTPHPVLGSVFQPKSTSSVSTSPQGGEVTILDFGSTGNGTHVAYTETIAGGAATDPAPIVADAPSGGSDATFALSDGASISWTNVTTWNNNADDGNAGENYFAATGNNVVSFEITTANPDDTVLVEAVAGFARDAIVGYGDTAPSTVEIYVAGSTGWTTVGSSVGTSTGTLARGTDGGEGNVGAFRITITPSDLPEPPSVSDTSASDGSATISGYTATNGQYPDGTPYSLRKPVYAFAGTAPSHFSARLAPPLVGMGLLEAITESSVMALSDPDDADNDGISGRPQIIIDPETGQSRLGRFGYKGSNARVAHQLAGALNGDIGITTSVFPVLDDGTTGTGSGISDADLDLMTRYTSLLGVQARRNLNDAQALQGETLFASAGCAKCHTPQFTTSSTHPMAELREQTISPYTDLLLHDMGPGLADNMGEGIAAGSEWRTAPLWNLGHTAGVNEDGEAYLHDGRAETLEEAILWHGGEADESRNAFCDMSAADRAAIIAFLESL